MGNCQLWIIPDCPTCHEILHGLQDCGINPTIHDLQAVISGAILDADILASSALADGSVPLLRAGGHTLEPIAIRAEIGLGCNLIRKWMSESSEESERNGGARNAFIEGGI